MKTQQGRFLGEGEVKIDNLVIICIWKMTKCKIAAIFAMENTKF